MEVDSAARGYLLAADEQYLPAYDQARHDLVQDMPRHRGLRQPWRVRARRYPRPGGPATSSSSISCSPEDRHPQGGHRRPAGAGPRRRRRHAQRWPGRARHPIPPHPPWQPPRHGAEPPPDPLHPLPPPLAIPPSTWSSWPPSSAPSSSPSPPSISAATSPSAAAPRRPSRRSTISSAASWTPCQSRSSSPTATAASSSITSPTATSSA
jgi:hypothetical protein